MFEKKCNKCNEVYKTSSPELFSQYFRKDPKAKDGLRGQCKKCKNLRARERRKDLAEKRELLRRKRLEADQALRMSGKEADDEFKDFNAFLHWAKTNNVSKDEIIALKKPKNGSGEEVTLMEAIEFLKIPRSFEAIENEFGNVKRLIMDKLRKAAKCGYKTYKIFQYSKENEKIVYYWIGQKE